MNEYTPSEIEGSAVVCAIETDQQGIISSVNQAFLDVTGYSSDQCLGKNIRSLQHQDMPPQLMEHILNQLQATGAWLGVTKLKFNNHADALFQTAGSSSHSADGGYLWLMSSLQGKEAVTAENEMKAFGRTSSRQWLARGLSLFSNAPIGNSSFGVQS